VDILLGCTTFLTKPGASFLLKLKKRLGISKRSGGHISSTRNSKDGLTSKDDKISVPNCNPTLLCHYLNPLFISKRKPKSRVVILVL